MDARVKIYSSGQLLQLKKIGVLLCTLLLPLAGYAQKKTPPIIFKPSDELMFIGESMHYLWDKEGKLTINDIVSPAVQARFRRHTRQVFNSRASKKVVWFKIKLQNKSRKQVWLKTSGVNIWYLDFYVSADQGLPPVLRSMTGSLRKAAGGQFPGNLYCFLLAKAEDKKVKTIYLRISSGFPKNYVFRVGTTFGLVKYFKAYDYWLAAFMGAMISMLVYNLFLTFATRDLVYGYYLGYLVSFIFMIPFVEGYPLYHNGWLWEYFFTWHNGVYLFVFLFAAKYLKLAQQTPALYRWIQLLTAIVVVLLPLLNIFKLADTATIYLIFEPLILLYYSSLLVCGVVVWYKGYKQARFYVFGWCFLMLGVFIFLLMLRGVFPVNIFTRHSISIGVCLEALMFSLALGDRLNLLKKEKEDIQVQNFILIRTQNKILEHRVKERTEEINTINEELHQSNEELTMMNEKLDTQSRQLQKSNSTKDQLFAIIGHDLRSPINSLRGLLDLVNKQHITFEEFQGFSGRLKDNVEHVHFTLNNLLEWANSQLRGITTDAQEINLFEVAKESVELLEEFAKDKEIALYNNIDKELWAYADSNQIKLVFRNLLSNALKFTHASGSVTLGSVIENGFCEVQVTDTGRGMKETVATNLFQNQSIHSQEGTAGEKGTGLGLVLCKEFVENNKGTIRVESKEGVGSVFYFTVPVEKP